jgi:hypothetical protein
VKNQVCGFRLQAEGLRSGEILPPEGGSHTINSQALQVEVGALPASFRLEAEATNYSFSNLLGGRSRTHGGGRGRRRRRPGALYSRRRSRDDGTVLARFSSDGDGGHKGVGSQYSAACVCSNFLTHGGHMKFEGELLPEQKEISEVRTETPFEPSGQVVSTRDHEVIKRWAEKRQAQPATGEATSSGPATIDVNDGGAGIRFNFPGTGLFRPISWDEWLSNFDRHLCAFVYERDQPDGVLSNRYRIVKASQWKDVIG